MGLQATRREWIGLAVLVLPCLLYSMDLTVLNLAVPHLAVDLAPSSLQMLWIVDIYGFLLAGSLITMGTLGDRIGRRRLLMIGAAAFGAASAAAAFSTTPAMLIAARALLGVAAATLAPSTLSLIRTMFADPLQRRLAIGIWVAGFSAGGTIGPLVGGALLAHFWWGSVFLLAVPVMAALLLLAPRLLPESRDPRPGRLDLASAGLSLAAALLVIYGIKHIAGSGLDGLAIAAIAAGAAVGVAFVRRQRRLADPLIDLALFRAPGFGPALGINVMGLFVAFGAFLFIAQYLQLVLGMPPLEAGIWTVPSGLAFVAGSVATPALARRVAPNWLIAGGFALAAAGFALLTQVGEGGLGVLVAGVVLFSAGLSPVGTVTTDLVVGLAPPARTGAASAISETSFEFGGALGIAVFGSIVTASYRAAVADTLPAGLPPEAAAAARDTLAGAAEAASRLPPHSGEAVLTAARAAFTHAFELMSALCGLAALAAAVFAALLLRRAREA
ncbi:MFS transporter [Pigmentiphaga soli]|uniref:MFS transporter n=1 Tax=Pigmentiphaga soli TaxID=1007095 RepID=A0ABP8GK68_9BURK